MQSKIGKDEQSGNLRIKHGKAYDHLCIQQVFLKSFLYIRNYFRTTYHNGEEMYLVPTLMKHTIYEGRYIIK